MLEGAPSLMAVTLLEELQRRHPDRFADAVLRTLQRRVGQWRAEHGGEREFDFAQAHPRAGWGCRTSRRPTNSTSARVAWPSRTGCTSFALVHSGWRRVRMVLGGERFQSLAAGCRVAPSAAGSGLANHAPPSTWWKTRNLVGSSLVKAVRTARLGAGNRVSH